MNKRGKAHTSLTETAKIVVGELQKLPSINMIAPGVIEHTSGKRAGKRHITIVRTSPGCELIISGQSVQKVSVHTKEYEQLHNHLTNNKKLRQFTVNTRERLPKQ